MFDFIKDLKVPVATIISVVSSVDVDKDGCISVGEVIKAIKKVKRILRR